MRSPSKTVRDATLIVSLVVSFNLLLDGMLHLETGSSQAALHSGVVLPGEGGTPAGQVPAFRVAELVLSGVIGIGGVSLYIYLKQKRRVR